MISERLEKRSTKLYVNHIKAIRNRKEYKLHDLRADAVDGFGVEDMEEAAVDVDGIYASVKEATTSLPSGSRKPTAFTTT